MENILCAMSGGVDSAVASLLLREQGYDVTGVTLLLSGNEQDAKDARAVCDVIGIGHLVFDMKNEFRELVEKPFCQAYINGETPNPCVICNRLLKFGLLSEKAAALGFEKIATGHYVKKTLINGFNALCRADDEKKDQSYMLWQLSEKTIASAVFPLGDKTKPEIRRIAAEHGFPNSAKHDSQDVCFIPDGEYVPFIEKFTGYESAKGNFIDTEGNIIGTHRGSINFTVGQRKGLGMGFGKPVYVLKKDAAANTVTLGENSQLYCRHLTVHSANIPEFTVFPGRFDVKIRYAHKAQPAEVLNLGGGRLDIVFDEPQRAPAKGQSAVIYRDGAVYGGGFIE